jgi:hypothetical protein
VEEVVAGVGDAVQRPVILLTRRPSADDRVYATVVAATDAYYIFVRDDLRGLHRDLAISHELGHILAGHLSTADSAGTPPDGIVAALPSLSPALVARMLNRDCCHNEEHEREAERIATALLARGRDRGRRPTHPVARGFGDALQ